MGSGDARSTGMDGWLTVELWAESQELAQMLVFGLGQNCEVLAPDELRDAVLHACAQVAAHLAGGASAP